MSQSHFHSKEVKNDQVTLWIETLGNIKNPAVLLIAGAHAPTSSP